MKKTIMIAAAALLSSTATSFALDWRQAEHVTGAASMPETACIAILVKGIQGYAEIAQNGRPKNYVVGTLVDQGRMQFEPDKGHAELAFWDELMNRIYVDFPKARGIGFEGIDAASTARNKRAEAQPDGIRTELEFHYMLDFYSGFPSLVLPELMAECQTSY